MVALEREEDAFMEIISKESILNKLSEISRNTGLILGLAGSYARGTNEIGRAHV